MLTLFGIALFPACNRGPANNPQELFKRAEEKFLHGHLAAAQDEAEKGYSRCSNQECEWRFRLLKADILIRRGFSENALSLLNGDLPAAITDPDFATRKLILQALAYTVLGRADDATKNLLEAQKRCAIPECRVSFELETARAVFELRQSRPDKAEVFFRSSLLLARQQGNQFRECASLLNLGAATLRQERYDESIDWSNGALKLARDIGSERDEEGALGNLAWAYYRLGDYDKSLSLHQEAEKSAHDLGIVKDQTRWLYNLGVVYYEKNQLPLAENYFRSSLELATKIESTEQLNDALSSLAFVSVRQGNFDAAEQFSQRAYDLAHRSNDRAMELYSLFTKGQIQARKQNVKQAEQLLIEISKDRNSDASLRWQAQNELARLYEQVNQPEIAMQQFSAALGTLECARQTLNREEFRLPFLANAANVYDDYIRFLVEQRKTNEALQAADYSRAQTLSEGLGVLKKEKNCASRPKSSVSPQQAARMAGGTVLFYWLGQRQSYLWIISTNNTTLVKLPSAAEIDPLVQSYRKALLESRDVLESGNKDGSKLYDILVAPARKFIPANSHVTIIADGSLNNLNFETLLVSEPNPHYWIEDVNLTNASSLRMLAASNSTLRHKRGKLLLIGDPIVPDPKFPPLPSAKIEMQNIEKHFAPGTMQVYSRSEANPTTFFKSNPESFSYLHFVAHGTASQLSPLDSAVILSKATAEEDSYKLHARDIIGHPLHADLAVISTCYGSGSTLYNGEGLVGLSWAFLRAGAHNVIGALWAVSDASTPQLMDQLYAELMKGRSPQDALRTAKLSLLHSQGPFRKPIYWASFQLYTGS